MGRVWILLWVWSTLWGVNMSLSASEPIRVAVASNFLIPMKILAREFTEQSGIPVTISSGSSGTLFAKIKRGAPYDLFFSADVLRPQRLEKEGWIEEGSRFTYVIGRLVAWSSNESISADLSRLKVGDPALRYLAMANPKIAPYGTAAVAVLKHYGLYEALQKQQKIVLGENVGKAYQYVVTGSAQIGLVAQSYVVNAKNFVSEQVFNIPESLYPPLHQQAVVIRGRKTHEVAQFLTFFYSDWVRIKLISLGYDVPPFQEHKPL